MSRTLLSTALLIPCLIAGCSGTVSGHAVRTPLSTAERPLPDSAELARVVGLPLERDSAPEAGGIETLKNDKGSQSPMECAGVTHAGYLSTYQGAPLRAAARGTWITPQGVDDRVNVVISVVELDSADNAQTWYRRAAAQWGQCRDITVTDHTGAVSFIQSIRQVQDSDGELTAVLSVWTDNGIMTPGVNRRAFIVTSQYFVDAEVFGILSRPDASSLDASAVARLVVNKISQSR
jgi:hypothetical protein